jgi:Oxidoreductase family, NAD-binding Rossmann fold
VSRSSRSWKRYALSARSGWWICAAYFDDKDIDGVVVATPEHWHALSTVWVCQAGKDVYVEKCRSLSVWEGRKMIEASRKYKRILQVGFESGCVARTVERPSSDGFEGAEIIQP